MKSLRIPSSFQGTLWSADVRNLDAQRDKNYIVHHILMYGTLEQIRWLIRGHAIPLFSWKDIALDKAYTIGRHAQYRDYVDLFFLMKYKNISIARLIKGARKKFAGLFPEKLFLEQLVYLADVPPAPIEFLGLAHTQKAILAFFEKKTKEYVRKKL